MTCATCAHYHGTRGLGVCRVYQAGVRDDSLACAAYEPKVAHTAERRADDTAEMTTPEDADA